MSESTSSLLILLPPSEGKAAGGDAAPLDLATLSFSELTTERAAMIKAVGQLSGKPRVAQKTLGVKGAALAKAREDNTRVLESPTLPAIERYTGVMYDFIDYKSLSDESKEAFGANTIIMSGLFGMVRPFDLIPDYKLKMGAKIRRKRACSANWKPLLTNALAEFGHNRVVWDLLPNEHSAAWDSSQVPYAARFTVKFLEDPGNGQLRTLNHWSKAMKGALIRHLVSNSESAGNAESALDCLKDFTHPEGYEYRPEMSTQSEDSTELIFLKSS